MVSFFQNIIAFLTKEEIQYMLTGSMAMYVYTVARATQDFDFVVQLRSDDVAKVVSHFRNGYYCNEDSIKDAIRRKSMFDTLSMKPSSKLILSF